MARILRGDVVWADLSPVVGHEQAGRRPVVVLSADVFNERSGTVIAMALTSQPQRAGFPLTLQLKSLKLGTPAWVKISQVRTLSTRRLGRKLGRVDHDELDRLVEATGSPAAGFCTACLTGRYPVAVPPELSKAILEQSVPAPAEPVAEEPGVLDLAP